MSERLLTTRQAAERLGLDPSHIRRLCIGGAIPAEKHGRDWMIRESDVEGYVAAARGRRRREKED